MLSKHQREHTALGIDDEIERAKHLPIQGDVDLRPYLTINAANATFLTSVTSDDPITGAGTAASHLGIGYNTTNLKITSQQLNTIQDIATSASPSFTNLTDSSMTAGSILFAGTGGLISQDNSNLFWDDTNNRLGIGKNTPLDVVEIFSSANNGAVIRLTGTAVTAGGESGLEFRGSGGVAGTFAGGFYREQDTNDLWIYTAANGSIPKVKIANTTGDITTVGKIGVGKTPSYPVDVTTTLGATFYGICTAASGGSAGAFQNLYSDDGAAISNNDRLGGFLIGGAKDASHTLGNATAIASYASEDWSSTATGSMVQIETTLNGGTARAAAMAFYNDKSARVMGKLGVNGAAGTYNLYVPWISGDSNATSYFGSTDANNNQVAVYGKSNTNIGVAGYSTTSYGLYASSTSGTALVASSTTGAAANFLINPATTNTVDDIFVITRSTSGTAAAGLGAAQYYKLENDAGNPIAAGRLCFLWSNAGAGTETSDFSIHVANNGAASAQKFRLTGAGNIGLNIAPTAVDNLKMSQSFATDADVNGINSTVILTVDNPAAARTVTGVAFSAKPVITNSSKNIYAYGFSGNTFVDGANVFTQLFGGYARAYSASSATSGQGTLYGLWGQASTTGSGTVTNGTAGYFLVQNSTGQGTITTSVGNDIIVRNVDTGGVGAMPTVYGSRITISKSAGALDFTTAYGFYASLANATTSYGVYITGETKNYFSGNVGIGTTTVGTGAVGTLCIANGTQGAALANAIQLVSEDLSAGNTIPSIETEGTGITTAGISNVAVTNKIAIKVNGTVYYLLATTVGT